MVLPSYSTASQFLDPLSYRPSINLGGDQVNVQKVKLEAEVSRQAPTIRMPIFRAVRYVVLPALALEVL